MDDRPPIWGPERRNKGVVMLPLTSVPFYLYRSPTEYCGHADAISTDLVGPLACSSKSPPTPERAFLPREWPVPSSISVALPPKCMSVHDIGGTGLVQACMAWSANLNVTIPPPPLAPIRPRRYTCPTRSTPSFCCTLDPPMLPKKSYVAHTRLIDASRSRIMFCVWAWESRPTDWVGKDSGDPSQPTPTLAPRCIPPCPPTLFPSLFFWGGAFVSPLARSLACL